MKIEDISLFHDYGIDVKKRLIYMGSENFDPSEGESGTDGKMLEKFKKNLTTLENINSKPITIFMQNEGGDEYNGFAIHDLIKASPCDITVQVLGCAMSMGSIILQAADKRVMLKNAAQMIHYGTWGVNDHSKTTQQWAKEGRRIDKLMEKIYLDRIREKHPDFKLSKLRKLLDHDTFLTAEQSIFLGLADSIL